MTLTRRSVLLHSQYRPDPGAATLFQGMQTLYAELGLPLPDESDGLLSLTVMLKFDADTSEWTIQEELVSKLAKHRSPVFLHLVACTAWTCNSVVALTLVGSAKDNEDKVVDACKLAMCYSNVGFICTDVFMPGSDPRAAKVFLARSTHRSRLKRHVPDITLADVAFKPKGEGSSAVMLIPMKSKLGEIVRVTHLQIAIDTNNECGPLTMDSLNYVLRTNARNPAIGGETGTEFVAHAKADIPGVKPIHISNMTLRAEHKGDVKDWFLWARVVIVYRMAE